VSIMVASANTVTLSVPAVGFLVWYTVTTTLVCSMTACEHTEGCMVSPCSQVPMLFCSMVSRDLDKYPNVHVQTSGMHCDTRTQNFAWSPCGHSHPLLFHHVVYGTTPGHHVRGGRELDNLITFGGTLSVTHFACAFDVVDESSWCYCNLHQWVVCRTGGLAG
jgi:hypothetical protein